MKTICIDLVQKCELSNKDWFIKLVQELPEQDFKLFCKEIMHLNHHYATTVGCFATDQKSVYINNDTVMWEIESKDFNDEVNFKQVS